MKPASRSHPRHGFTIIELLVVCTIILILVGLTAGAFLRYADIQRKVNTEWLLSKLDSAMRIQWKAVIAQAKDEAIPKTISQMGAGDSQAEQRARVIYIKFRLMQEFPMTYAEVRSPPKGLQQHPSYSAMLAAGPPSTDAKGHNIESAVCLYMALSISRGGSATNLDQVLTGRETATEPRSKVKYLVDDWQVPLTFFRWPYKNNELNDPTNVAKAKQENKDLEDPNGLLSMNWQGKGQVYSMMNMTPPTGTTSYRLEPTIASAGRNGKLGLDPSSMATTNQRDENDNLYSHRTRQSGRGD